MESCLNCENNMPLDYLIKDYDGLECTDCRASRLNGGFYEPAMPLNVVMTTTEENKLRRLLKWALG